MLVRLPAAREIREIREITDLKTEQRS